jgi:hypothetical protein
MRIVMASAMMWIRALAQWTHVAYAMVRVLFTNVAVATSQRGNVIATVTSWTPSAFAAALALQMRMTMAFATMWIRVLVR